MRTFYITGATVAHNFTSQQQAGHTSHQSQSRHGSTHQRYTIVFIDSNYILNYYFPIVEITRTFNYYQLIHDICLRSSSSKNEQKSAWLNRAGDLLDLSSGDSRDNTPNNVEGVFNQPQPQQAVAEQGNLTSCAP